MSSRRAKHSFSGNFNACLEFLPMTAKHKFEELRDGLSVLPDLLFSPRVEYGKACIDVPLVGVDAEHEIALDVFNTANIAVNFPRELVVREPCRTHAQKGSMCHSLRVCCDPIMLLGGETDVVGAKT